MEITVVPAEGIPIFARLATMMPCRYPTLTVSIPFPLDENFRRHPLSIMN